jgi:predicted amidophosphoribosyltransferase
MCYAARMKKSKLIPCPACKHPLSRRARKCPHCGHDMIGLAELFAAVCAAIIIVSLFMMVVYG